LIALKSETNAANGKVPEKGWFGATIRVYTNNMFYMLVGGYSDGGHAEALDLLDKAVGGEDWRSFEIKPDNRELQGFIDGELEKLRKECNATASKPRFAK
jgi:hypothetical protein